MDLLARAAIDIYILLTEVGMGWIGGRDDDKVGYVGQSRPTFCKEFNGDVS